MVKLLSILNIAMAYGSPLGTKPADQYRVVVEPGVNEIAAADFNHLGENPSFINHSKKGFYKLIREEVAPEPKPIVENPHAQFVADFLASPAENQAAMLPTLTPEQLAAVEAEKAKAK